MATDNGISTVEKIQADISRAFGLTHPGGPKHVESSDKLRNLPAGSDVIDLQNDDRKIGWADYLHLQK